METDEHAAVIRLYGAFFSQGRVALAEELHSPGFVYHDITHPDQVVEEREIFDVLGLYQQLGLALLPA